MMKALIGVAAGCAAIAAASAHDGIDHARESVTPQAQAQLAKLVAVIAPYRDFQVAKRAGWKQFGTEDSPLMGEHWFLPKEKGGVDYVHGDAFDWSRPSNLMYTDIGGKRVLTGVTFNMRLAPGEAVPAGFDGPNDKWHVHDFEKALAAALQDRPMLRWLANGWLKDNFYDKGDRRGRIAMVHVWVTLPNPDGVFAHVNRTVPYLKLGLPVAFAEGASEAAAKGLHLATAKGCTDGIEGALWIANAPGKTGKALKAACGMAAAHVREGLASGDKTRINVMAEHGWTMFDAAWKRALTPAQRMRIASISEHGPTQPEPAAPHAH